MNITDDTWRKRIEAARDRREVYEPYWQHYCKLHFDSEQLILSGDNDRIVELPTGDTVRLGLIFRNIEQTLGYLEMDDFGITARATSYTRPLDNIDTNNEAVVEQAIYESMKNSGLFANAERIDRMKLDALLVGHSVSFSWWKLLEEDVETERIPVLVESEDGTLEPKTNKNGEPVFEPQVETVTLWEGVVDERISPLEFLISSTASSIDESPWLGFERIIRVSQLKDDPRYAGLPKDLKGGSYEIKTLQGERGAGGTDLYMEDSIKLITVWDRDSRELITFLETSERKNRTKENQQTLDTKDAFIRLKQVQFPVKFDNPLDSPFAYYIPIPANDHPFGISQVEHTRNPAIEGDMMHTRFANLSREQKRLWLYDKNKADGQQIDDFLSSKKTVGAVGMDVQDGEDLSRVFKDMQNINIPDTMLNAATLAEETVRKNSGVAETPFGGTETATESENQMMIGQARVNRKRNKLFTFLEQIAQIHLAYLRKFAPTGSSVRTVLADGTEAILEYGREAFAGKFVLKVEPGGGPTAISPVRQKMMIEAIGMVSGAMGPKASLLLYREVLTQMDIRNVNGILQAAREFMIPPEQPPMPPGAPPGMPPALPNPNQMTNPNVLGSATNTFG